MRVRYHNSGLHAKSPRAFLRFFELSAAFSLKTVPFHKAFPRPTLPAQNTSLLHVYPPPGTAALYTHARSGQFPAASTPPSAVPCTPRARPAGAESAAPFTLNHRAVSLPDKPAGLSILTKLSAAINALLFDQRRGRFSTWAIPLGSFAPVAEAYGRCCHLSFAHIENTPARKGVFTFPFTKKRYG